jgi:hypothetical protein
MGTLPRRKSAPTAAPGSPSLTASCQAGEHAETAAGKTHTFTPRSVRCVRDWLKGSTSKSGNQWVQSEVWGRMGRSALPNKRWGG